MRPGPVLVLRALSMTLGVVAAAPASAGQERAHEHFAENQWVAVRLVPRTLDQTAAFYEAREFPDRALKALAETCFLTVLIENRSTRIVWLEPKRWQFLSPQGAVQRLDREYWRSRWSELDLPLSNRSTFGWTLLPQERDLQPGEAVGGNVVLPRIVDPFSVEAHFRTGAQREGPEFLVHFDDISCRSAADER